MVEKINVVEVCEKCEYHSLDILADGRKEHYCYPPLTVMCFAIPCNEREIETCKMLRKMIMNKLNI